ncbi:hypothetical protein [Streptomyces sp. ODS28]|uniref:hypothetical protein n=1 Tax=Streptomyces sp. ODS28 TaxID=3136688 RepID=UPI0031EA19C8
MPLPVAVGALGGLLAGWSASALWAWAERLNARACEGSDTLCLPLHQFVALIGWLVAVAVGYAVLFRLTATRPLVLTVPACLALAVFVIFVAGPWNGVLPTPAWWFLAANAVGPALVVLATRERTRWPALIVLGLLLAVALLVMESPGTYM